MIQRIQSIYMLAAVVLTGVLPWFVPLATETETGQWNLSYLLQAGSPYAFIAYALLLATLLGLINIFLYKNRKLQLKINAFNIILLIALSGAIIYILFLSGEKTFSEKGIGVVFPVLSILFLILANRGIGKDENLVKSLDRIR